MSFQLTTPTMSSQGAAVNQHLRDRMVFSPTVVEKEFKLISMKFHDDADHEQQITHWVLRKASPTRDTISHAMGFIKIVEPVEMAPHKLAAQYRRFLAGSAITPFDKALRLYKGTLIPADANEPDLTQFHLETCLKYFVMQRASRTARYDQIRGLQACKKPRAMDCNEWEDNFLQAVEAAYWLSGDETIPEGNLKLRQYIDTYPEPWVREYERINGNNLQGATYEDITAFMKGKADDADAKQRESAAKSKSNGSKTNGDKSRKKKSYDKSYDKKRKSPSRQTSTKKLQPDDPCPLPDHHHPWGKCWNNINNPEARKRFKSNHDDKKATKDGHNHATQFQFGKSSSKDESDSDSDNEPGFTDGKSNGYKHPAASDAKVSPTNYHHLSFCTLQDLQPQQKSKQRGSSYMNTTPRLPNLHGNTVRAAEQGIADCMSSMASTCLAKEVMDPESNLVKDDSGTPMCFSNSYIEPSYLEDDSYDVPSSIAIVNTMNGVESKRPLRVLFDACSTFTHIYEQCLPKGCKPSPCTRHKIKTLDQVTYADETIRLDDIVLPEFSPSKHIDVGFNCLLAKGDSPFDIIFGDDFLSRLQIDPLPSQRVVKWMDMKVPYRPIPKKQHRFRMMQSLFLQSCEPSVIEEEDPTDVIGECFSTAKILDSKYEAVDVATVAAQQKHLTLQQRDELYHLLSKFKRLFSGKLGTYPHRKMDLQLVPDGRKRLRYQRPYPVAQAHKEVFKHELDRLVEIGVLSPTGASFCAAPTFIIPKKDGRVRWVSDFRELNSVIERRVYPLPKIADIFKKRSGYKYFTKLDVSMQYYTFELTEEAKDLCVISTPFGLYRYNRAPMGIKQSPDFAQQAMEETLRGIESIDCYLDDVGCFDNSWEAHLKTLELTLSRLQEANFTINPLKCEWAVKETDWLGYWVTPTALRPWKKKVDAILKLDRPQNIRDVRSFIGAVTFYRELFPQRSDVLQPLHELTAKGKKFEWTKRHQAAFDKAKSILASDVFIRYPDQNKPFHVYTDASDYQLGAVIMQEGMPVAYYSKKLTTAQRHYTTMEKELLSIVYTLNEYRSILYGCKELHIHTDHKNLTYANLNSQRVLRWRLFLEDFHPTFHYVKGTDNSLADALSRLPRLEEGDEAPMLQAPSHVLRSEKSLPKGLGMPMSMETSKDTSAHSGIIEDPELVQCFLNFPEVDHEHPFALDYASIAAAQRQDARIVKLLKANPKQYTSYIFKEGTPFLICRQVDKLRFKICLPDSMLENVVDFYHTTLAHIGQTRLLETIQQHFENPRLKEVIHKLVSTCDACQKCKLAGKGYGTLPPREPLMQPWYEVAVDLIGPWTIRDVDGNDHTFMALTIIDTVTNLCEIALIRDKTSSHIGLLFENTWLARYPMPLKCIYDQGNEFLGPGFQRVLNRHNIQRSPTGVKNPQANSIVERLHQSIANSLRVLTYAHPPRSQAEIDDLINTALQTASYAAKAAIHSTMKLSPGAMCFSRDMVLNIPVLADFRLLQQRKEAVIRYNLLNENRKRISYDYAQGEQVLKLVYKPNKMEPRALGPYPITRVHTNGTVTIKLTNEVSERINIRQIKPYRS